MSTRVKGRSGHCVTGSQRKEKSKQGKNLHSAEACKWNVLANTSVYSYQPKNT